MTTWKTLAVNFSTAHDPKTLEGLPGVNVAIHLDEDDSFEEADARDGGGLKVETLQTDVQFQLRLAGIRVLTDDELPLTPSCPVLSVTVSIVEARGDLPEVYRLALTVGLYQTATLTGGMQVSAETWNIGHVGFAASSKLRTLVREQIKDKTKAFVNAWLAVNQK